MSRLAGKVLQIRIDDFSMKFSRANPKEAAMEQLVRHMERECPKCVGCRETKLQEDQDHRRMAKLFSVTCKQNIRHSGDMLRCPDGFTGIYDASAKEVREAKLEMPVTTTSLGSFDGSMTMPSPRWVMADLGKVSDIRIDDEFMREYMTDPMLAKDIDVMKRMVEEKAKRIAEDEEKLMRRKIMLNEFDGNGIGKISAGLADMLGKKQIPSDRTSFPPVQRRNKDVPLTSEEEAW